MGTLHGGVFRLKRHTGFVRTLMASASIAFAVALAGCQTDDLAQTGRAMQPLSRDMQALIEKKGMSVESPMLVRIFKEESELELWKQDKSGQFALLKTYPICRWSGDLGPKVKQGDRQAPEGFYTITPGQMNPNSKYYLAFNLGFPNTFDKAHDRSGAFLMVHGDCSSAGCYSMSDDQMAEIYALGREAFLGGQKSFQVQAFPFRMTALNLAKHRNSPHLAFWKMIKEGSDHFEVTRQEPKVDVCDRRYVFNATAVGGTFNSRGSCPSYRVPDQIAASVKDKRERDERQFVALVSNGTQTVSSSGSDGGMHPVFVAKLQPHTVIDTTGRPAAYTRPGSGLPTLVRLPRRARIGFDAWQSGADAGRFCRSLAAGRRAERARRTEVRQFLHQAVLRDAGERGKQGRGEKGCLFRGRQRKGASEIRACQGRGHAVQRHGSVDVLAIDIRFQAGDGEGRTQAQGRLVRRTSKASRLRTAGQRFRLCRRLGKRLAGDDGRTAGVARIELRCPLGRIALTARDRPRADFKSAGRP